jgi:hypothetical protein
MEKYEKYKSKIKFPFNLLENYKFMNPAGGSTCFDSIVDVLELYLYN